MTSDSSEQRPGAMALPPLLSARVTPSLVAWMDWLCPRIDDTMLAEIARADYGHDAVEHLRAPRRIRDQRVVPDQLASVPIEVLELVRWSRPDDPAWTPGRQGRPGHLLRLFCCAVLLTVADNPELSQYFDEEPTLRSLVDSAIRLGDGAPETMAPLLCWRLQTLPALASDRPFMVLGVLLLVARSAGVGDGPLLNELCRWVIDEEAGYRARCPHPSLLHDAWLLGLKFFADGDDCWRALAWEYLIEPRVSPPAEAVANLRDIGARLVLGEPDGE